MLLPAFGFAAGRGVGCDEAVRSYLPEGRLIFPLAGESDSTGSLTNEFFVATFGSAAALEATRGPGGVRLGDGAAAEGGAGCFARVAVAEPLGGCSGAGEGATLVLREAAGITGAACTPLFRCGGVAPRDRVAGGIELVVFTFSVCAEDVIALQKSACFSAVRRTGEAEPPRMSRWPGVVAATRILAGSDSVLDMLVPSLLMRSARGALRVRSIPFCVIRAHSPNLPLPCSARPCLTSAGVSG